jgi:glycerophosphoryl diester phosphodiesterase
MKQTKSYSPIPFNHKKDKTMKKLLLSLPIFLLFLSCSANKRTFDEQAHRGGRGLMPENTIASQKNAINYDCTMEMDLQMSKDRKIVVSHDAYFNSQFCLDAQGDTMTKKEGYSRLIYDMPYDSIAKYDCGSKTNPAFPQQKDMHTVKPLLSVLIDSVEAYGKRKNHVNHYNIEIKSNVKSDGKHYPSLAEYVDSAMAIIERKGIAPRTMIQSFDVRALRMVHKKWPKVEISYLVGANNKKDVQGYIDALGFKPDIFSPNFHLVTAARVKAFHKHQIRVIPWTPDKLKEMQKLKDMGVDGEITDYPNLYSKLK